MNTTKNDLVKQDANTRDVHNETREACPECKSIIGHKILCRTGNERAKAYQSKLRCTKAPIPYVEALAKERNQLRAKLNRMTAQRDELLAALKEAIQRERNAGLAADTATMNRWQSVIARCDAANLNTSDSPIAKP